MRRVIRTGPKLTTDHDEVFIVVHDGEQRAYLTEQGARRAAGGAPVYRSKLDWERLKDEDE